MEIIDLPHDVFLIIVAHLSARTVVRCRRVSRRWNAAFSDQDFSLQLMKWHFPRCREMRLAYATYDADTGATGAGAGAGSAGSAGEIPAPTEHFGNLDVSWTSRVLTVEQKEEGDGQGMRRRPDWTATFTNVAGRYYHLRTATPRSIEKIRIGTAGEGTSRDRFFGVGPWDRYLRLDQKESRFHYPDPSWCYGQEDGVLVYHVHPEDHVDGDRVRNRDDGYSPSDVHVYYYPWRLLDLETQRSYEVPFPHDDDRIVRRVRLSDGVLVFEWCERLAYHQLNYREECHRHYVTAFDIGLCTSANTTTSSSTTTHGNAESPRVWTITERAEWKLHFLGFPLNQYDRFFSAHTRTHYAVYVWQPNRSEWGEDDPIESVLVWDISAPVSPPKIIRRMTWSALAFYGVRQRATPKLRHLAMDERNLYFVEEEHRWAQGGHSSLSPPRGHLVRCTGLPIIPVPSESLENHEERDGEGEEEQQQQQGIDDEIIVLGPRWHDQCGANGDANLSFCSRLNTPSYSTRLASLSGTSPTSPGIWNGTLPSSSITTTTTATLAHEIDAAIRAPTSRWPGWAPCWRHEEFPYLTGKVSADYPS